MIEVRELHVHDANDTENVGEVLQSQESAAPIRKSVAALGVVPDCNNRAIYFLPVRHKTMSRNKTPARVKQNMPPHASQYFHSGEAKNALSKNVRPVAFTFENLQAFDGFAGCVNVACRLYNNGTFFGTVTYQIAGGINVRNTQSQENAHCPGSEPRATTHSLTTAGKTASPSKTEFKEQRIKRLVGRNKRRRAGPVACVSLMLATSCARRSQATNQ